jgi:rod shape-determining protein MreC
MFLHLQDYGRTMFKKKYQTTIIACTLLVFSLIVLSYSVKQPSEAGFFRKLVLEATAPLFGVINASGNQISSAWNRYLFLVGLEEENRRLKKENALLANELLQYREGDLEQKRLYKLLNLKESLNYPTIAARVIAKDQTSLIKTILIDKGTAHGIRVGLPVVADRGVVGRIMESSWHVSRILLLIDENSNIDALLQEGRNQGILQGGGSGVCDLKYIPKTETVKVGDVVISAGLSGVFPKGLLLGVVTGADKNAEGMFQKVPVVPFVDFEKLEEVLVFLPDGDSKQ